MSIKHLLGLGSVASLVIGLANGAVYSSDFEAFAEGDLNGQFGWEASGNVPEVGYVLGADGGIYGGKAASIGFLPLADTSEVYVRNSSVNGPLLSIATFSVLFQVVDSSDLQSSRDTFGFRLAAANGDNLFSFFLNPVSQSSTPEQGNPGLWTFGYSTGAGPQAAIYSNPQQTAILAAEELESYNMTIAFNEVGLAGDVGFSVNVNGFSYAGGVIPGLATSSIAEVGAFWRPTDLQEAGSNYMVFDNISVVPEPGLASLAGIAGFLCLMVRRRA